jgi:hypothetical protein
VSIGEGDAKHRPGQDLGYRTGDLNWFLCRHGWAAE